MWNLSVDSPNVLWALGGLFLMLCIATLIVTVMSTRQDSKDFDEVQQRLRTWWIIVFLFGSAILLSSGVSLLFFGLISFLALKEFFTLAPTRRVDRNVLFYIYLCIPIQYMWAAMEWYGMFIIFIPVYMFLFVPMRMVLSGNTRGFLKAAGILHWGVMVTIFSISHLGYLLMLPDEGNPNGGGAGLVLFLVIVTQLNDVAQFIWGKSMGRTKILPTVSPGKTWGGFLGGVGTTTVISLALAPWLTPLSPGLSVVAGIGIATFGFMGDVCVSAVKRDLGLKDTSQLLPGHGGILDRVDSLTYTAPLFFHFVYYTCF